MSGHNKWSKIKNKKALEDSKKSKLFSMVVRQITLESKKTGGNKNAPGLRAVIEQAKSVNMPNNNIERAIKRGLGPDAGLLEEVLYETYGPGGVALVIPGLTDNKNRTVAEVKTLLGKYGFSLAGAGSAVWAFKKSDVGYSPTSTVSINEEDQDRLHAIVEALESLDDVVAVFSNAQV